MFKDLSKVIFTAKAAVDVIKEKIESKACDLAIQIKAFTDKNQNTTNGSEPPKCKIKEKAKEELLELVSEITHRAQINQLQLKSFVKDKLIELTNNALLDSTELNDIRADIATLRAELGELKSQIYIQKR